MNLKKRIESADGLYNFANELRVFRISKRELKE